MNFFVLPHGEKNMKIDFQHKKYVRFKWVLFEEEI